MSALWLTSFVAGCGTGSILTLGSTPFELVKVRFGLLVVTFARL